MLPNYSHKTKDYRRILSRVKRAQKRYNIKIRYWRRNELDILWCKKCNRMLPKDSFHTESAGRCGKRRNPNVRYPIAYCKECVRMVCALPRLIDTKLRAFTKIDPRLICSNCGCNDINLLEINHMNGGGKKELDALKSGDLKYLIINGSRKTDDLNLLCRPCNGLDYLERKFGRLPLRVVWDNPLCSRQNSPI